MMEHCDTCLYQEECDCGSCLGYVEDDEAATARAEYEELSSEIRRDEHGESEGICR